jgi:hypothetical protein
MDQVPPAALNYGTMPSGPSTTRNCGYLEQRFSARAKNRSRFAEDCAVNLRAEPIRETPRSKPRTPTSGFERVGPLLRRRRREWTLPSF